MGGLHINQLPDPWDRHIYPYCLFNRKEDMKMRSIDFSPLYRTAIGFDHLFSLLDNSLRTDQKQPTYPPYNIELTGEDSYRITMALAGFDQSELNIEVEGNSLRISGQKAEDSAASQYLHRGIATRSFQRQFQLADHIKVTGAALKNGLLHIDLEREIPEALKPRKIAIQANDSASKTLDNTPIEHADLANSKVA
jgi:molecular chaperone IbpA